MKLLAEHNSRGRICTPDELEALVENASAKLRLAILLGYHTGMRMGETCSLTWEQIDLTARTARLKSADTKTGAAITGNKDRSSLRRYNTITVDDLRTAVDRLESAGDGSGKKVSG